MLDLMFDVRYCNYFCGGYWTRVSEWQHTKSPGRVLARPSTLTSGKEHCTALRLWPKAKEAAPRLHTVTSWARLGGGGGGGGGLVGAAAGAAALPRGRRVPPGLRGAACAPPSTGGGATATACKGGQQPRARNRLFLKQVQVSPILGHRSLTFRFVFLLFTCPESESLGRPGALGVLLGRRPRPLSRAGVRPGRQLLLGAPGQALRRQPLAQTTRLLLGLAAEPLQLQLRLLALAQLRKGEN